MNITKPLLAVLAFASISGCRPDEDALEPNDSATEATQLAAGEEQVGVAIQDNPDFFVLTMDAGSIATIDLSQSGGGFLSSVRLVEPGGAEFVTRSDECNAEVPAGFACRVDAESERGVNLVLELTATVAGDAIVVLLQESAADNQFPFYFDYTMTVDVAD